MLRFDKTDQGCEYMNENELKTKNLLERKRFRQEPSYCPNKLLPFFNYHNAFIYFTFLH